jgi:hypothetical protein
MGYRSFIDSMGVEWQAWDIVPRLAERRARERRMADSAVATDRRMPSERRQPSGIRAALSNGLSAGWLCFETTAEKRRLTPIPADWMRCAIATLEEYLRSAVPAMRANTGVPLPLLSRLDVRAG